MLRLVRKFRDLRKNKIPVKQSVLKKLENLIGRLINRKSLNSPSIINLTITL